MNHQAVVLALLLAAGARASAADFTWTNISSGNASGSWTAQTNWSGGTLPTTSADTAWFNQLEITA
ncbi:MAG: hypothetical protein P4M10_06695, partial [Verrucomicrobiae bacterium]|nr:hypothetical protein [Verrucomicrobiae bacterium]